MMLVMALVLAGTQDAPQASRRAAVEARATPALPEATVSSTRSPPGPSSARSGSASSSWSKDERRGRHERRAGLLARRNAQPEGRPGHELPRQGLHVVQAKGRGLPIEGGKPFRGFAWRSAPELNINAIWLYRYMSKPETGTSKVGWDHVVVAKKYIGPIAPAAK